ncbi:glutathione S-transferase family protein [Denitrobaculum tricleocarpae]|uniref:Glutathione S-transferase family protein n=1 Tax=Denitrobaculum tricleocarpae TaxID=2591009 RepID=A0A545TPP1_9PROT|nr:glutathione S-transferase family protein [Denitrobaculum tricleocarpae]TQV79186.1 glutathione S-transferase family protein [Denitrobaculum tricleocarpae]
MKTQLSALDWAPEFAQGYVKDLRVRWALEEAGLSYEAVLLDDAARAGDAYRTWQPFGQVPAYRDGEVEMFESGAILLHLAAKSEALAPRDPAGFAKATSWVIAALNSVEPAVQNLVHLDVFYAHEAWAKARRPQAEIELSGRLEKLANWLGAKDYLLDRFTAGDLMMATVLREVPDLHAYSATLDRYLERCLARPAFERALDAQMRAFRAS